MLVAGKSAKKFNYGELDREVVADEAIRMEIRKEAGSPKVTGEEAWRSHFKKRAYTVSTGLLGLHSGWASRTEPPEKGSPGMVHVGDRCDGPV